MNNNSCQVLENRIVDEIPISSQDYNDILNIQLKTLEMMASKGKTADILNNLCKLAESLLPNSVSSVMLINQDNGLLSVECAPSVPQIGHDALANLKPGPGGGSCGNAVFKNSPQFVHDTFNDERWMDIRQVAYDFNLCSCWSMPIRDEDKKVIGSFALSSFEHRLPTPFHKKLLETSAAIVNLVFKNESNEKRLQIFSAAMHSAHEGMIITDKNNKIIEVNTAFEDIYGVKEKDVVGMSPSFLSSGKHDLEFYQEMWKKINDESGWSGEIINKRADNSEITQWMSISILQKENNTAQNYLAVFSDLTELKETQ